MKTGSEHRPFLLATTSSFNIKSTQKYSQCTEDPDSKSHTPQSAKFSKKENRHFG